MTPAIAPDGRYIVVDGRLWRRADPGLPAEVRQGLVDELMAARRAVGAGLRAENPELLAAARLRVQAAKEALGERGEVWWDDGAPDLNRRSIENTLYAPWWHGVRGPATLAPPQDGDLPLSMAGTPSQKGRPPP